MAARHRIAIGVVLVPALVMCASSVTAQERVPAEHGAVHALLINGGKDPASNYLSHLQHLQRMVDLLRQRGVPPERIHVFSADGEDPAVDLATRSGAPQSFWLIEETSLGKQLRPTVRLVDTEWRPAPIPQATLRPAKLESLREWFEAARTAIPAGDRLLVFVTDHGGQARKGQGSGTISLWREDLTVREFRALLDRLSPQVQVVTVMSQCYSGAFADLMYDRTGSEPSGSACGFFSTSAKNKAYGCYPESREEDRVGYAFEVIDALGRQSTVGDAHAQVVRSDNTPDMPRRTSDAYLAKLIENEAAIRRMDADALSDLLLERAWDRPGAWDAEIAQLDAIAARFSVLSSRSLVALKSHQDEVTSQGDRMKAYADRWKAALAAPEESLVRAFLSANPAWASALEPRGTSSPGGPGRLDKLPADERAALLVRLLDELYPFARRSSLWAQLEQFQDTASRGAAASYRFEVRKGAVERMRTILTTIAGRELLREADDGSQDARRGGLAGRTAQRQAFDALVRCEAMELGSLALPSAPALTANRPPFPSLKDETTLLDEIRPSYLGVRYGPIARAVTQTNPALSGASQIQYVEEGSAAAEAGFEIGDVLIGPPDQPFKSARDIRNWTTTSPRERGLPFKLHRPGADGQNGHELETVVRLRPYPSERIGEGVAPRLGSAAPILPAALKSGRPGSLPDLRGRAHLLYCWATWCSICKAARPEIMAFAESKRLPVLAITDEDQATVSKFLDLTTDPFFEYIALDASRRSFVSHGVSGTPVLVMVDEHGIIRYRQVGYGKDGLEFDGWRWKRP